MPREERGPEQDDSIQVYGGEQANERYKRESIEGGSIEGVEGGLRVDFFEHDHPDDIQCLCDLPEGAQDLIIEDFVEDEDA